MDIFQTYSRKEWPARPSQASAARKTVPRSLVQYMMTWVIPLRVMVQVRYAVAEPGIYIEERTANLWVIPGTSSYITPTQSETYPG